MPRYKPYDYDQLMMIPVSLEEQLVPGTLEYAIHHLIENHVDTSIFNERFSNDETGRLAYSPKVLLKIVLFGYSRGILSSRSLERASKESVTFMALACGQQPDHSTIAAFVSSLDEEVSVVFSQILLVCEEEGLLGGTHFSMDGLKLPSNASKEWSGTHTELRKKQEKLESKVRESIREHRKADKREGRRRTGDGDRRLERIKRLRRQAERIGAFLAETEPKRGRRGKEIQSNVTDNDSAKMVTAHGVVQGYNSNALVDEKHQVVVYAEAFGDGDDGANAVPMLEGGKRELEAVGWGRQPLKGKQVSADTGYYSMVNLKACREHRVDAYIPDREFRKRDPRFADARRHRRSVDRKKQRYRSKKRWFGPEDFTLDESTGKLICPGGERLYVKNRNFEIDGCRYVAYQAPKRACRGCQLRSKCLRNPKTESRQVHVLWSRRARDLTDEMKRKVDTAEGRATYAKRLGIVEPVFGNLRACKRLDRFTLRGRVKVNTQWVLYCLVHNIEKILHFGRSYAVGRA